MVNENSGATYAAKTAAVFPGQGSQSATMAAAYDSHPQIAAAVEEAAAAIDLDLPMILGDEKLLNETENTQPALLAVCIGVFRAARIKADIAAGHSLGEYAALVCGGAIAFGDAVRLVRRRGELMRRAARGGMAAILGDAAAVEECCAAARKNGGKIWAANFNSPQQIVVAGDSDSIAACREWISVPGIKQVVPLPVGAPSHCPLMHSAAEAFAAELRAAQWKPPFLPVIHNATLRAAESAKDIVAALTAQLIRPVRWTETLARLSADGAARALECGPGGVLCGLARRTPGAPPHISLSCDADLQLYAGAD